MNDFDEVFQFQNFLDIILIDLLFEIVLRLFVIRELATEIQFFL